MAKKKASDCPLQLYKNGQWGKKVRQKRLYFGTDKDAALKRWADEKDYHLAGRPVPRTDGNPSITELGNLFIENKRRKVAAGKIEVRTVDEYQATIAKFIKLVGAECRPLNLSPLDFADIRCQLAIPIKRTQHATRGRQVKHRSEGSVSGDIRRIRVFLSWCVQAELIPRAPRYGDEFSPASLKEQRRARAKQGRQDLTPEQIHAILDQCHPPMKAMVLLAINAGIGNLDLANLTFTNLGDIDKSDVMVSYPRGKTGAPRRFFLWAETIKAIRDYLKARPVPRNEIHSDIVFLTRLRQPWVRRNVTTNTDSISFEFNKARKAAGLARGAFYDLRRTFRTVAAGAMDREAVDLIMGHADDAEDMGARYTQHIEDSRIRKVCDHVHGWLFGAEVAK